MQHRNLIENDYRILKLLAEEREFPQYNMGKRLDRSYRTVMRRLSELKSNRLVMVTRRELSRKGGKRRKIYTLTFKGLVLYLASISITPIRLVADGGKTKRESEETIRSDIKRYKKEAKLLIELLELFGKKLDYAIFKDIRWLLSKFSMRIEHPVLAEIIEAAKFMESRFSNEGFAQYIRRLKSERARLKREKKLIQKHPFLTKLTLYQMFGDKKEEIQIDVFKENEERLKFKTEELESVIDLDNRLWRTIFTEHFFSRIVKYSPREKLNHKELRRQVQELQKRKKHVELQALEKAVNLFDT